jgi:hypothetical protein
MLQAVIKSGLIFAKEVPSPKASGGFALKLAVFMNA